VILVGSPKANRSRGRAQTKSGSKNPDGWRPTDFSYFAKGNWDTLPEPEPGGEFEE